MTITYNTASIVTTDLQLHLDAANAKSYSGSGTFWTDFSANSVGTLNGSGNSYEAVTQPPSFLYPDGTYSRKINISSSNPIYSTIGSGAYTLEVWANVNITPSSYQYLLDLRTDDGSGQIAPILFFSDTRKLRAWSGTSSYFDSTTTFSTGYTGWKQFAISRTNTSLNQTRIYIDGVLDRTNTNSGSFNQNIKTVTVGASAFGLSGSNGYIGAVRFYRRALSGSELQQNYNAQRGRYGV